jgi:dTDP-4-dehydrorhamnose reductase
VKVLVTGAGGMLGQAVVRGFSARGHQVAAYPRSALDVTDAAAVEAVLRTERPEAVVQCAAYTAVDRAEEEEGAAFRVNAEATRIVARACHEIGARFVYPSTDYVFDGKSNRPYRPGDATGPLNVYGRSKLAGELMAREAGASLVVRTSWLFGSGGPNFVETIRRLAAERDHLEVVDDQLGRPTHVEDLTSVFCELLEREVTGTLHATGGGDPVSWYGLARFVVERLGLPAKVKPVASTAFPRPAMRPAYSVLDCSTTALALGHPLAAWPDSVERYLLRERMSLG